MEIVIGEGTAARNIMLNLPPFLPTPPPQGAPVFISVPRTAAGVGTYTNVLIYFRDRLFLPERPPENEAEREEIILRVKKAVYEEDAELSSLRNAVANLEAAIEFKRSGPRRDQIPDDVKLVVWARDGGACVRCGSNKDLHFDHIIPVAKGGGNSAENIQILCQSCNLKKSDKITIA